MTDKDSKKIKKIVQDILEEMISQCQYDELEILMSEEPTIPISLIDEMEDYLGEQIIFMGIS
tara:strand:- start:184 stop:369 length:186 start_codon:yes stop_codon:yes gene_type:complete